jgi:hypothetical protein
MPVLLLHNSTDSFASTFAYIAKLSLIKCFFPAAFNTAQELSLIEKPRIGHETAIEFEVNVKSVNYSQVD